ncbi:hypothetical protein, partial [Mesorhizobium sp. M1C.F.Ca.ET.196.01.1.1]|uniref:hypothetical protein n=1 Tax=Mesorhizobium sp. M1C.F.Ca.ET.196.01.1.1 TaxID=2563928 RepID=UPI001AEF17B9
EAGIRSVLEILDQPRHELHDISVAQCGQFRESIVALSCWHRLISRRGWFVFRRTQQPGLAIYSFVMK